MITLSHTHTYMHTYTHTYTHTYIHTHTYTHTYIHTCIHTYIHTHTHTHTHTQLRGVAGKRQVENARIGLQQNFGIGGAAVVTIYGIQSQVAKSKL